MSLPTQTYYADGKSFFAKDTPNPVFSTVTVTTGFAIDGLAGQTWDVLAPLTSTLNTLETVQYPNVIQHDWQSYAGSNQGQQYTVNMNGANNTVTHAYSYDGQFQGALSFQSTLYGGGAGIQMAVESGNAFYLREDNTTFAFPQDSQLNLNELNGSNLYLQYYSSNSAPGVPEAQIHFNSATSSISLVSQTGQAMGVGSYGIGLNPGTGSPVTLTTGYINVNNSALSNVSSINGSPLPGPVTQWIDPVNGPYPTASTPGNANTIVPIKFFSTIANNITRVSLEFQSANGGGGSGIDITQLAVASYDTSLSVFTGRINYLDTYNADLTNGPYVVATSFDFEAIRDVAGVVMINDTIGGNVQNGTLYSLTTQDMGAPVANY